MTEELIPYKFICEPIEVSFDKPPLLEKKPGCPDRFSWREDVFIIVELIKEWHDYERRGHMSHNMREAHARAASRKGSWGVGQDYYRVRTADNRYFDLSYDRAPKDINNRKGSWLLEKELKPGG